MNEDVKRELILGDFTSNKPLKEETLPLVFKLMVRAYYIPLNMARSFLRFYVQSGLKLTFKTWTWKSWMNLTRPEPRVLPRLANAWWLTALLDFEEFQERRPSKGGELRIIIKQFNSEFQAGRT